MPVGTNLLRRSPAPTANPALGEGFVSRSWGPRAWTGLRVSNDEALEFTAVYRALKIIGDTLGGLPIHVFDSRNDDQKPVQSPSARYIWDQPNPEHTRVSLWSGAINDQVWTGNAFLFVSKNARGEPLQLWPLNADRVEVGRIEAEIDDGNGRRKDFLKVYRLNGRQDELYFDFSRGGDILHVMGAPDPDRGYLVGKDPRRSLLRALGIAKAAEDLTVGLYNNNSSPAGVLSTDQEIPDSAAEALQQRWEERHAGGGRIAVTGYGVKFQPIAVNPVDSQLLESRQFQVTEIARHFGIPGQFLGAMGKNDSFASGLEELMKYFESITLSHHYIPFEQAVDKHLIGPNFYMKFELGGLLRGSLLEQYQAHRLALGGAAWDTVNHVRALNDLPPVEGGDVLMTPLNMGNAGSLPGDTPPGDNAADPTKAANGHVLPPSRCPDCNKLLGMGLQGIAWCVRCKGEKVLA